MVYGWDKWLGCLAMGVDWTGMGAVAGGVGEPGAEMVEAVSLVGFFFDRVIMSCEEGGCHKPV